jgi:hypothetical protein
MVEQPVVDMGKAARLFFERLAQAVDVEHKRKAQVSTRLIVRAATGPLVDKGGQRAKQE